MRKNYLIITVIIILAVSGCLVANSQKITYPDNSRPFTGIWSEFIKITGIESSDAKIFDLVYLKTEEASSASFSMMVTGKREGVPHLYRISKGGSKEIQIEELKYDASLESQVLQYSPNAVDIIEILDYFYSRNNSDPLTVHLAIESGTTFESRYVPVYIFENDNLTPVSTLSLSDQKFINYLRVCNFHAKGNITTGNRSVISGAKVGLDPGDRAGCFFVFTKSHADRGREDLTK